MTRTMTSTIFFFCMAMAFPAFAADKKGEKKKGPTGEKFGGMDLTKSKFEARNFEDNSTFEDSDCTGTNFGGAILKRAVFTGADLTQTNLEKADMDGADFRKAKMDRTWLRSSILTNANFEGVDLTTAVFYVTNLRGANLRNLKGIGSVKYCKLQGADLRGANLSKMVVGTTKDQHPNLTKAKYDKDTRWPEGFDPVEAGAVLVPKKVKK